MLAVSPMTCPSCRGLVRDSAVDRALRVAQCPACEHVFDVAAAALLPPRPAHLTEHVRGDELTLSYRWFRAHHVFLGIFGLFWNGFLVMWYSLGVAAWMSGEAVSVLLLCFPVIHVAVGVAIAGHVLAGFLNRTRITVSRSGLTSRHGPVPWLAGAALRAEDVRRVTVREVESDSDGEATSFGVVATLVSGEPVTLAEQLPARASADYLASRVEGWLGIPPEPVPDGVDPG